jgi:anti-sigma regulatory factor (Ser/Thr protein kinase)
MAASKLDKTAVRKWAIETVQAGEGAYLTRRLTEQFNVSRITAARALKQLVQEKWLASTGGTRPMYRLGENRQVVGAYQLPGIDESLIWVNDFAPMLTLKPNVMGIAHYGFTEMLNNANDHSEGTAVSVHVNVMDGQLTIAILDNGVGIFEKIGKALNLPDRRLAMLELSKGKFTTDPSRHSGEGVFFTSRMFDRFQIDANSLCYNHDIENADDWLHEGEPVPLVGTLIRMTLSLDSKRASREVFDAFSGADGDYGFDKTVVPVKLARIGDENLVSRSQAKRLVARFEGFKTIRLDFNGVDEIGQAFADEIFRVFAAAHPNVALVPVEANEAVMRMVNRAKTHGMA